MFSLGNKKVESQPLLWFLVPGWAKILEPGYCARVLKLRWILTTFAEVSYCWNFLHSVLDVLLDVALNHRTIAISVPHLEVSAEWSLGHLPRGTKPPSFLVYSFFWVAVSGSPAALFCLYISGLVQTQAHLFQVEHLCVPHKQFICIPKRSLFFFSSRSLFTFPSLIISVY